MINPIISQIQKEIWMMEQRAMAALVAKLFNIDADVLASLMKIENQENNAEMQINDNTAIINIHGILMKNPPSWLAWFGIETTDYNQIRRQLADAIGKMEVQSILLHIDSPGGTVAGTSETADAIAAAGKVKPVMAEIEDLGASGAYYLASQAKSITANLNAEVGAIGVFTVYDDYSKAAEMAGIKTIVIRSGEHKGMGVIAAPITDEQIAAVQDVVNGMAENFIKAVSSGRNMSIEAVRTLADGRVFLAADAKNNGLIDSVIKSAKNSNANMKENNMTDEEIKAAADAAEAQKQALGLAERQAELETARSQAGADEKTRLKDLEAAFPNELQFIMDQFKKGNSVEKAKVEFCDVLTKRLAESETEKKKLQDKVNANPSGADPIHNTAEGGSQQSGFMEMARQRAKDDKCSITDAMKRTQKESPELYEEYIKNARQQKVA